MMGSRCIGANFLKYNAFNMGPRRDVVGELFEAFRREGLTAGVSTHQAEHWFFMGHGKSLKAILGGTFGTW